MTVTQLIKELEKIKAKNPRAKVLVKWDTFASDDHTHMLVNTVEYIALPYDVDGSGYYRKDGTERIHLVVSLSGQ